MSAEWHYTYSEADNSRGQKKRDKPEPEEVVEKLSYDAAASMTPKERRLHELREKLKQSRNENRKAVEEEEKKAVEGTDAQETKRRRLEYYEKMEADRREAEESGMDVKKKQLLTVTAEEAERKLKSKSKKKARSEATFGWEKFGSDAEYNAYKNRQKDLAFSREEYEKQKASDPNFYREAHDLDYGQSGAVAPEKAKKMVAELDKLMRRRSEFSRRRDFYEEEDVTYINDRNRKFNQKAARAYDPYTSEIKQNLERGTAI